MRDERSAPRPKRHGPAEVARVARRQGGAISVAQAKAAGLKAGQIKRKIAAGWLVQEHRGVLRLGTLTPDGHLWEALLMMGDDDAALSRLVAGYEHGLLRGRPPSIIDVTAPSQHRRRGPLRPHRGRLAPQDIGVRRGLPFTTIARTLLDLAAILPGPQLDTAVDEARHQRKLHQPTIEATIARASRHHGIGRLRASVARHTPGRGMPRKERERRLARFLAERDYPPHERNAEVRLDGKVYTVDVLFTGRKVVIEFDSRQYHDNDPRFVSDRRRIRRFEAHGWRLVPITSTDLTDRQDELDRDLKRILDIE